MGGSAAGVSSGKSSRAARKTTSKAKGRNAVAGGLMLTSMLDILTCILFFLLKNYSSTVSDFAAAKDITLPSSTATIPPEPAMHLVVTREAILLDNNLIATIVNGEIDKKELHRDGVTIVKLFRELKAKKDSSLYIEKNSVDNHSFTGTIVLQADKSLNFNLIKKVIYTAGVSDFVMLKLAVLKKET